MAGSTFYPTSLDDNTTLSENLTDGPTGDDVLAAHQNNQNAAIKALEAKVGIDSSAVNSSIDYFVRTRLGWNFSGGTTLDMSTMTLVDLGPIAQADSIRAGAHPFVDPMHSDYGAVGDGVTDDSAAIQAAIDACPAYGYVVLGPHNYVCESGLTLETVTLIGHGTTLTFNNLGASEDCITIQSATGKNEQPHRLIGITVVMDGTNGRDGIRIGGTIDYPILRDVFVKNATRDGIHVEPQTDGLWIENLSLYNVRIFYSGRHGLAYVLPAGTMGSFINESRWFNLEIRGSGQLETGVDVYIIANDAGGAGKVSAIHMAGVNTDAQSGSAAYHDVDGWQIISNDASAIIEQLHFESVGVEDTDTGSSGYAVAFSGDGALNAIHIIYFATNGFSSGYYDVSAMGSHYLLSPTTIVTDAAYTSPDINTPDIDGGTVDGAVIGGSSPAAGSFTTLSASSTLSVTGTVTIGADTSLSRVSSGRLELNDAQKFVIHNGGFAVGIGSTTFNTSYGSWFAQGLTVNSGEAHSVRIGDFNITMTGGTSSINLASIGISTTVTVNSGNAHNLLSTLYLSKPVVTLTSGSVTQGATLWIEGPTSGPTTNFALVVDDGIARFDGDGTHVFQLPADATDPTGGGGAATGRIPVKIGGVTRYIAYY